MGKMGDFICEFIFYQVKYICIYMCKWKYILCFSNE